MTDRSPKAANACSSRCCAGWGHGRSLFVSLAASHPATWHLRYEPGKWPTQVRAMSTYGSIRTNERALLQKQTDFRPDIGKDRPMGGPNVVQCSGPSLNVLVTRADIAAPICGHLFKLMQM